MVRLWIKALYQFLVLFFKGILIIKSVMLHWLRKMPSLFATSFEEIVEIVGPKTVVDMFSDNAAH